MTQAYPRLKFRIFENPRWQTVVIVKNRKIVISQQLLDRSAWNMNFHLEIVYSSAFWMALTARMSFCVSSRSAIWRLCPSLSTAWRRPCFYVRKYHSWSRRTLQFWTRLTVVSGAGCNRACRKRLLETVVTWNSCLLRRGPSVSVIRALVNISCAGVHTT